MEEKTIKILGISGSLRETSRNTRLLSGAAALAPKHMILTVYKGLDDLPHFNPDMDGDEPPASVKKFRAQLQAADGVIICTPEYAGGVPGVLKNALDWLVSSGELTTTPTAVISASPSSTGGDKAHASLLNTLNMIADVVQDATLMIPLVSHKISAEGIITDSATAHDIKLLLHKLSERILAQ